MRGTTQKNVGHTPAHLYRQNLTTIGWAGALIFMMKNSNAVECNDNKGFNNLYLPKN